MGTLRRGIRITTVYEFLIILALRWFYEIIVMSNRQAIQCITLIGEDLHLIEIKLNRGIGNLCLGATFAVYQ